MDKLVPAFKESVFDAHLGDVLGETVEFGIDSVLDEGILKDIPIVSTVIGFAKTAQNIYDRNLLRQTATFIQTFNAGSISPKKLQQYRAKIDSDPQYAEKDLGRVLILLNSYVDLEKSAILAKFYRAYVEEEISWEQFGELSEALNRLFIIDLQLLTALYDDPNYSVSQNQNYKVDRLVSQGFVRYKQRPVTYNNMNPSPIPVITDFGKLFISLS